MGSATTQALAATTEALNATSGVDLGVARELFAAARALGGSSQLATALADSASAPAARAKVVADVFGAAFAPATVSLLTTTVQQRWSSASDLIDAVEELGIRASAIAEPGSDVEGELFGVTRLVAANPELELALGSRLGDAGAKGGLIEKVLGGSTGAAATLIVSEAVQQPRERRVRQLLTRAMRIVAAQRGRTVATVVTAQPLTAAQSQRLQSALTARYGTGIALNVVVDPTLVGGVRVEIADDVIDASVASRLHDLRQKLAG